MNPQARWVALDILNRFDSGPGLLDSCMEEGFARARGLEKKDRSQVTALVQGTVRHRASLDFVIAAFSTTPLRKIKPAVLNILRLSLFQMMHLRVSGAVAVDAGVRMAKKNAPPHVARFVNGLLRSVGRKMDQVPWPDWEKDPARAISVRLSFPAWMVGRWVKRWGVKETRELCRALNEIPPLTLRANTLKAGPGQLARNLSGAAEEVAVSPRSPCALMIRRPKTSINNLPGFREGHFTVQDEAAQLACWLLDPRPGLKTLDACAGRGTKTGYLAQLMDNSGVLLALDKDPARLTQLGKEMERLGASMVQSAAADLAREFCVKDQSFDRVLVDAPCSGLGVIRRHPDAKWIKTKKDPARNAGIGSAILENAAKAVAPGGRLVYAVCTLEPEETQAVARKFLSGHPDFEKAAPPDGFPEEFLDGEGFLTALPHVHNTDGFFAAAFEKKAGGFPKPVQSNGTGKAQA